MEQDITANADAFANDIMTTGHSAVYGIYFDTGKADQKSSSDKALIEISSLLQRNPGLKIYVVGHTDSVGDVTTNMTLFQKRSEAVI